jgi:hypothetical protein
MCIKGELKNQDKDLHRDGKKLKRKHNGEMVEMRSHK